MKKLYFIFLLIYSLGYAQLTPPSEFQSYYNGVNFSLTGTNLYNELATKTIAKHSPFLTYSQRHDYLYDADEDLANISNVILVYSGESRSETEYLSGNNPNTLQTFNTEHVYPRSLLNNSNAEADLHLLRTCDISVNSSRGNDPFTSGSGNYASNGNAWYPGDEWKGDIARIILYVNLRYNESFSDVGSLNLFLQWNAEDPVSPLEIQRNTVISGAQGNRNPFIDNPYIATVIWGGPAAENRWEVLGVDEIAQKAFTVYPNPSKNNKVIIQSDGVSIENIKLYSITGQQILVLKKLQKNNNRFVLDNLPSGFYVLKINSEKGTASKKLIIN